MTTTVATRQNGRLEVTERAQSVLAETLLRDVAYVLSLTRKVRESMETESATKPVTVVDAMRSGETSLV